MSLSVIMPIVSPFLPETSTHPMLCLAMGFATSAAVSDSLAVITGLVMMSRTITDSGSVSCTDKAGRAGVSGSIKSSSENHRVFRQNVISTTEAVSLRALSSTGSNIAVQTAKEVHIGRLPPASLVYWIRVGFGVLAGVIFNLAGFGSLGVGLGTLSMITVGIGVYSVSVFLVKNLLGYGPEVLKGPNKHVTIGIGSYVIWMIFTTILLYTVLNPHPS